MNYDYFIAGRYRNKENIAILADLLRNKGKTVYCFLESPAINKYITSDTTSAEESATSFENLPNWRTNSIVREIFETDMEGLRESKNFILLLPAGKSAHVEAGAAYGMGKHCIVIGEQKEAESLHLIFHEHYDAVDDFMEKIAK